MTEEKIINRLTAEALHQTTVEGMRLVIMMAYSAGADTFATNRKIPKRVASIDSQGNIIREFESVHEASIIMNCTEENISHSMGGKWKAKGYYWKYI